MAKVKFSYAILIVLSLLIATKISVEAKKLSDELCLKNQNLVKVHFYGHDVANGPNATAYEVAHAAVSTNKLFSFGKILVFDDMLTTGPGRDSEKLGKAQGIVTSADMETTAMAISFNVVFTSGEYNGSTLSIAGRDPLLDRQRSLAVVGGTGVFRFTRGYVVVSTYSTQVGEGSTIYLTQEYFIYTTFCPLI